MPGVSVNRCDITGIHVGTTTHIRLRVEHDAHEALPQHWFVKQPSQKWRARWITRLAGLLTTEARVYQELQLPVAAPKLLSASPSQLVLGDITEPGHTPGTAEQTVSADQAGSVITALACLHNHFKQHPGLAQQLAWLGGPRRKAEDRLGDLLAVPLMKRGLRLAGAAVSPKLHQAALGYARQRRHAMQQLACPTPTLTHHDCHAGNLYWQEGDKPGFLDWQLARLGDGVGDVAYFLATALSTEDRRQWEASLLDLYQVSTGLNQSWVLQRYRTHLCYAFEAMVVTLAIGGMMNTGVNLELIQRTAQAVDDHDSFSALAC